MNDEPDLPPENPLLIVGFLAMALLLGVILAEIGNAVWQYGYGP